MIERNKETLKLRHDMRQHFQLVGSYLDEGDIKQARKYLENIVNSYNGHYEYRVDSHFVVTTINVM